MNQTVSLRCSCGKLRGVANDVSPQTVTRVLCYCGDCRAFADFLERPDVLDPAGGSDLLQTAQANVRFTEGDDTIACVRLSDKGMFRWYAGCCRTPIGSTMRAGIPFVGLLSTLVDLPAGSSIDDVLGTAVPISVQSAVGPARPTESKLATLRLIASAVANILRWKLTGRSFPSPFFDETTRSPRVAPKVLSGAEREALRARDRQRH